MLSTKFINDLSNHNNNILYLVVSSAVVVVVVVVVEVVNLFALEQVEMLSSRKLVQCSYTNLFYCSCVVTLNKTAISDLNWFSVLRMNRIISVCQAESGSFTVCSKCLKVSN
jgi:hypothetical protein